MLFIIFIKHQKRSAPGGEGRGAQTQTYYSGVFDVQIIFYGIIFFTLRFICRFPQAEAFGRATLRSRDCGLRLRS